MRLWHAISIICIFTSSAFAAPPSPLYERAMKMCVNTYGAQIPPRMEKNLLEVCGCAAHTLKQHRPAPSSEEEMIDQIHKHFMRCGGMDAVVFGTK
jgi:hypothetical protein